MNYFFITGSSKGLGKALTDLLLTDGNNVVYGLSRTNTTVHSNYTHVGIDLCKLDQVEKYQFPNLDHANKVVLVNNAGMVGDVKHVGNIDNKSIIECYNLNLIAPVILTNSFISKYRTLTSNIMILNISSGAGRHPIDGWNVYCSTKAGIDMFSQVLNEEIKVDDSTIKVLSLAPGIIDTGMQQEIRNADQKQFSNIKRFIDYKNHGDLAQPESTAQQVLRFIQEEELMKNVICSVRDLTE